MSYFVINDFRFGLDKRRLDLANRPGALTDLVNAHITNGGEIEKRKAFSRVALAITAGGVPVSTFGFTALKDTIEVYGNVPEANIDLGSVPANITYRDLRLSVPVGPSSNITYTLIGVVFSTVFRGKSFVIGSMSGGFTALFYDGQPVLDGVNGIVRALETNNAGILRRLGNSIADSGQYTTSYSIVSGLLSIFGTPGASFSVAIVKVSTLGTLTEQKIAATIPGTIAQVAAAAFKVIAGSVSAGTNKVSQVAVGATNLLAAAVDFAASTIQTAANLSVAINANTAVSGYRATAEGSALRIFAVATGTTPNGSAVVVTAAGDVCIGFCAFSFAGTGFNLNYINVNGINVLTAIKLFPVAVGQTLSAYVETVAADIRAGVGVHGYVAKALGTVLYLSKATTSSSDTALAVDVEVVPTAGNSGIVFLGSSDPMLVSSSAYFVFFSRQSTTSAYWLSEQITITVKGGIPPYTFRWPSIQEVPELSGQDRIVRLTALNPTSATCQYQLFASTIGGEGNSRPVPFLPSGTVKLKCQITDSTGEVVESPEISFVMPGASQ